jgi:hypothetical protein
VNDGTREGEGGGGHLQSRTHSTVPMNTTMKIGPSQRLGQMGGERRVVDRLRVLLVQA